MLAERSHEPWIDEAAAALAALLTASPLTVQPGAGHFPWVDDPRAFAASVEEFLAAAPA